VATPEHEPEPAREGPETAASAAPVVADPVAAVSAWAQGGAPSTGSVIAMQRSAGNGAVARMLDGARGGGAVIAREPTAAPAATGKWIAPFGMGGFGNTADASAALIDVGREMADLAKAGYPDAQPLSDEAPKLATELAGSTDLTAEQATKLNEYTTRVSAVADPAVTELRDGYLKELDEWAKLDAKAQQTEERLAEKLHHDFMDAASESVVSKTKEALGKAKEYAEKAKDYAGYIEKAKVAIKGAEKFGRLAKAAEELEGKAKEAEEILDLAEAVLTIAGQIGEAPGQYATDVGKLRAGMKLANFVMSKANIPLIGEYFKFLTKGAELCYQGILKIAQVIDDSNRERRRIEWEEKARSGGPAPTIDASNAEDLAHTWPGGQPMLNLMWNLMRDDEAVGTFMTPALEDYFVKFRSQFNAGEKDELETDTHWYDPTSWFGRTKSPNLKTWLVAHKATVWSQLYGSLPHP
jgi:hypothetical protein